ncbi:MAG: formamidopyrimidine-DNA glycosylase [Anaerolineales bacterium]|nr:formamidopyrimidine-DNA glycosylase [Anaerolineales bacterium]
MPELPEVETYVRELKPLLDGATIAAAAVFWPRTVETPEPEIFIARIAGRRFQTFGRRGKYMLLGLDDGLTLVVHLRMTGQLGPEPFDAAFTPEVLAGKLAGRTAPIKALLLDQRIVAGVGNIYADESLFRARIHPTRPGGSLSTAEIERLHGAIAAVLLDGIDHAGSSLGGSEIQNYIRPGGEQGGFQEEFRVFQRTSKPCLRCGAPVERIVVAQRSTHFCPACQPIGASS